MNQKTLLTVAAVGIGGFLAYKFLKSQGIIKVFDPFGNRLIREGAGGALAEGSRDMPWLTNYKRETHWVV